MSKDEELKHIWDTGLTDKEHFIIGSIIAQWGALEAEVFSQTLDTFGTDIHVSQLPKEMNNLSFTSVLGLWKSRVVDVSKGKTKAILEQAHKNILRLTDARNSIIHGMWDFSLKEPNTISTYRVKKDKIIHTVFEDGALADIYTDIAEINANIRYPGGMLDFFQDQMRDGCYVNEAEIRRMKLESDKK